MNDELKPCPFCGCDGNKLLIRAVEYDKCINIISCPNCKIEMTTPTYVDGKKSNNRKRVISTWNRRLKMDKKYVDINAADFRKHLLSFDKTIKKQTSADHFMIVKITNYIKKVLLLRPPADVQEVRHGRWETPEPDGCLIYDKKAYKQCSNCKAKQFLAKTTDKKMKYCPHCGAKMDGSDNDD